ncbi:MAG: hypothetical protein QGH97_05020 [Dehalococcoidia bacterium]|nr:hypothetical protein [Dehalococcoidia bacterium]
MSHIKTSAGLYLYLIEMNTRSEGPSTSNRNPRSEQNNLKNDGPASSIGRPQPVGHSRAARTITNGDRATASKAMGGR